MSSIQGSALGDPGPGSTIRWLLIIYHVSRPHSGISTELFLGQCLLSAHPALTKDIPTVYYPRALYCTLNLRPRRGAQSLSHTRHDTSSALLAAHNIDGCERPISHPRPQTGRRCRCFDTNAGGFGLL